MNKIELFFKRPLTATFQFWSFSLIAIMFLLLMLMMMNGCRSFEKTTKYEPNTYWGNGKGV